MEYYKQIAIYIVFIFISICIVGNYIIYVSPNTALNSLDFSSIKETIYAEKEISIETRISEKIEECITYMRQGKCEELFYILTDNCKAKYSNSITNFTQIMTSKYFAEKTVYEIEYMGYNYDDKYYLYMINIQKNPYLTDEEKKMEVYKEREIFLKVFLDENQNYSIDFDI